MHIPSPRVQDDPDDKLYLFQFPNPFPHFVPDPELSLVKDFDVHYPPLAAAAKKETPTSPDKPHGILKKVQFGEGVKVEDKDDKKEARRIAKEQEERKAMLRELQKQEAQRKPEGRIGTLVVMKSGRVKMVLGKDIVMDVSQSLWVDLGLGLGQHRVGIWPGVDRDLAR